jgi:hypothetical protein
MRRKKHKHTRRTVSFYKINHGFREPFKVSFRALHPCFLEHTCAVAISNSGCQDLRATSSLHLHSGQHTNIWSFLGSI